MTPIQTVSLPSGGCVSRAAVQLLFDLEGRGFHLSVRGNRLGVAPGVWLTLRDRQLIEQHLVALALLVRGAERVQ